MRLPVFFKEVLFVQIIFVCNSLFNAPQRLGSNTAKNKVYKFAIIW
jgi:hypothetical protein